MSQSTFKRMARLASGLYLKDAKGEVTPLEDEACHFADLSVLAALCKDYHLGPIEIVMKAKHAKRPIVIPLC